MHVLVIEQGTCALYETGAARTSTRGGARLGRQVRPRVEHAAARRLDAADAAGLPILPGLVKVAEVKAGAINHALRFTVAKSQQAYIAPGDARRRERQRDAAPMGLRLRLKASFDLSSFTGASLVILTAMKQYGLILADNGSNWYVSGDSDDAWTNLMDQHRRGLRQGPRQRLRGRADRPALDRGALATLAARRGMGQDGEAMTYPFTIRIPVLWGDMDMLGHVNNARFFRWLESARIAYAERIGLLATRDSGPILATTTCDFLRPVVYPATVVIGTKATRVGTTSITMEYGIWCEDAPDAPCARASSVIVLVRYATGEKLPVPEAMRAAIAALG